MLLGIKLEVCERKNFKKKVVCFNLAAEMELSTLQGGFPLCLRVLPA